MRAFVAEYDVRWDAPSSTVAVEARIAPGAGTRFAVDDGAESFVHDLEAAADDGASFTRATRDDAAFVLPPCARGCRIRYRVALREAARSIDDLDVASEEGDVVQAPPSTWLLAPADADPRARVRFRVRTSPGSRFVTGVFRARDDEAAWDITLDDLATSPYSAFGPFRTRTVDAPGATIELAIASGRLALSDDQLAAWTKESARAVATYLERFPMPSALVMIVPARGAWVGGGRTLSGGGGSIFMRVGARASPAALAEDWVLVHEMLHLSFPSAPREQDWAEEGLATYVEPFARVRAGLLSAEDAWRGLAEGLPNGLPRPGDRGLDHTPTWGRIYWGGALFYLLADVEIRKRTNAEKGLEHALRGILAAGGNNASRWPLDESFAAADRATGVGVLRELHDAMGASPHPVDLDALLRSLGVAVANGRVTFDERAPLAAIRRAITTGR